MDFEIGIWDVGCGISKCSDAKILVFGFWILVFKPFPILVAPHLVALSPLLVTSLLLPFSAHLKPVTHKKHQAVIILSFVEQTVNRPVNFILPDA